jgi:methionyl-tRNA synthetase
MPETKDNDFTWADFQARNNNELVAILGNFVNRVLVLTQKYFGGKVPAAGNLSTEDQAVLQAISGFPYAIGEALEQYRFREALGELMNLARLGNKYLADAEPWKLIKTDEAAVASILHVALQLCASLNSLMEPFLPFTARRLAEMLNHQPLSWASAGIACQLPEGHQLGTPGLLFSKVEDSTIQQQVDKLQLRKAAMEAAQQEAPANPLKETIQYDDFARMDLRVGTILEAEKVAKTKKLLKLLVDTGVDQRVIVSGIAEHYSPESLIGQQVLVLANLAPRALKGIDSHGMLLMAEDSDGSLKLMQPQNGAKNGSVVA